VSDHNEEPFINWKHIDGPLLICRDGHLHWLTLWERFQYHFGLTDLYALEEKHSEGL